MANQDQLTKVAMNCSKYNPNENTVLTSSTSEEIEKVSCENCTHFTSERKCDLDLIDKILSSMAMELK